MGGHLLLNRAEAFRESSIEIKQRIFKKYFQVPSEYFFKNQVKNSPSKEHCETVTVIFFFWGGRIHCVSGKLVN